MKFEEIVDCLNDSSTAPEKKQEAWNAIIALIKENKHRQFAMKLPFNCSALYAVKEEFEGLKNKPGFADKFNKLSSLFQEKFTRDSVDIQHLYGLEPLLAFLTSPTISRSDFHKLQMRGGLTSLKVTEGTPPSDSNYISTKRF